MKIEDIKDQFNSCKEKYDSQRKCFIPCFEDYYEVGINILAQAGKDFKSILDLGAGTGLLSKFLYEKFPSAQYTLVDIAEQMLEIAKIRFNGLNNFRFLITDYSSAFPDGEYDLISSALSIHHLENNAKESLYCNIYKKLPAGGCFINIDQFNASSEKMNEYYNKVWYNYIKKSGISDNDLNKWLIRKDLDKENTVPETLAILKRVGFSQVECVYKYIKFGVVIAIKS